MISNLRSLKIWTRTFAITALLGVSVLAGALLLSGCQAGENYPSKPILFVVPYAPGGGSDIMVRNLDKIAGDLKAFPQPFVIENKAGAGGITGKAYAKEKPADGYTVFVNDESSGFGDLMGNSPFKYNDFTYISNMVRDYNMVVATTESKYKTMKDLVADAKANPGKIKVGGTGVGNTDQIQVALITKNGGGQYNYISFDSGGQVITNLLGGQIDAAMANPSEAYEQIRAGKVRALAITAPERVQFNDPIFKEIPTLKESGVNFTASQWRGISGPPGIKQSQADWLIAAFKKVADSPEWKAQYLDKFQQMNAFVSGADFKKAVDDEYNMYKPIFDELGLAGKK